MKRISLSYWYLLAYQANQTGQPIIRPLWYEFDEAEIIDVEDKVMLGEWLLIVPFLDEDTNSIQFDLPKSCLWYNYNNFEKIKNYHTTAEYNGGRTQVYFKGGGIIPVKSRIQKSARLMFGEPFTLLICLDENQTAAGELYSDDGETFNFKKGEHIYRKFIFNGKVLISTLISGNINSKFVQSNKVKINEIKIAGLNQIPTKILKKNSEKMNFVVESNDIFITNANLPVESDWKIEFEFDKSDSN